MIMTPALSLLRTAQPLPVPPIPLGLSAELAEQTEVLVASYGALEAVRPALVTARREFTGYWEYLLENAIFTAPPHPNWAGAALIGPGGHLLGIGSLFVGDALQGRPSERRLPGNMFIPIDRLKTHSAGSAGHRPDAQAAASMAGPVYRRDRRPPVHLRHHSRGTVSPGRPEAG